MLLVDVNFPIFRLIKEKIDAIINQAQGDDDGVTEEMLIPADKVGLIIGKGGETIRNMQVTNLLQTL